MLTLRQARVLRFIVAYQDRTGGVSPTLEEIAQGVGLASKGNVSEALAGLEMRGFLRRLKHHIRAIEVLKQPPGMVPIYDYGQRIGYVT